MATDPWLIPDPNYIPTSRMGDTASIDCVCQTLEVKRDPENGEYIYVIEIINELRDIMGNDGAKAYVFPALNMDQYLNVWDGVTTYPYYKIGDEFTLTFNFSIIGADQDHERENAYVFKIKLNAMDQLPDIIGSEVFDKSYLCLAKGVDEYIAQLPA